MYMYIELIFSEKVFLVNCVVCCFVYLELCALSLPSSLPLSLSLSLTQHPRVRYAACNALGQLANDFAPTLQTKYHEKAEQYTPISANGHLGSPVLLFLCSKDFYMYMSCTVGLTQPAKLPCLLIEHLSITQNLMGLNPHPSSAIRAYTYVSPWYRSFLPCWRYWTISPPHGSRPTPGRPWSTSLRIAHSPFSLNIWTPSYQNWREYCM